jgi:lysophospholipase L1-like esterase
LTSGLSTRARSTRLGPLVLAAAALSGAGCDSTTAPTSFGVSCPISQLVLSLDGQPVRATYAAPAATGGDAPVTVTCSSASGALFPIGSTLITCTARDAKQRKATCDFEVQVKAAPPGPRLSATKFMAFGDSITEGRTSTCARTNSFMTFAETMLVLPKAANDAWAYPNVLQALLRGRYTAQTPTVTNRGESGESVAGGATRLPGALSLDAPEVLLLQEGANDVNQNVAPAAIGASLATMVREARTRGVHVLLGTLLPQRPLGVGGSCRGYGADNVVAANTQIRSVASAEGATLVDLYQAFLADIGTLIGPDGLHPSEAGYARIADVFFDAIKLRFEN